MSTRVWARSDSEHCKWLPPSKAITSNCSSEHGPSCGEVAKSRVEFMVLLLNAPDRRSIFQLNLRTLPQLRLMPAVDASNEAEFWSSFRRQQIRFVDTMLFDSLSLGPTALHLSRIKALRWQVKHNVSWLVMMEDDVAVMPGFSAQIIRLAQSLEQQDPVNIARLGIWGELYLVPLAGAKAILCRYCQSGFMLGSDNQLRMLSGRECSSPPAEFPQPIGPAYTLEFAPGHGHNHDVDVSRRAMAAARSRPGRILSVGPTRRYSDKRAMAAARSRPGRILSVGPTRRYSDNNYGWGTISEAFRERVAKEMRAFPQQPGWCNRIADSCRWGEPLDNESRWLLNEWRSGTCEQQRKGQVPYHFSCSSVAESLTAIPAETVKAVAEAKARREAEHAAAAAAAQAARAAEQIRIQEARERMKELREAQANRTREAAKARAARARMVLANQWSAQNTPGCLAWCRAKVDAGRVSWKALCLLSKCFYCPACREARAVKATTDTTTSQRSSMQIAVFTRTDLLRSGRVALG